MSMMFHSVRFVEEIKAIRSPAFTPSFSKPRLAMLALSTNSFDEVASHCPVVLETRDLLRL